MYTSFPLPCECARRGLGSRSRAQKSRGARGREHPYAQPSAARCAPASGWARGIAAPSCPGILSSNSGESGVALPVSCRGAALSRDGKKMWRPHKSCRC